MQIPILNGIYSDFNANLRISYPKNMFPVPKNSGVSEGYLRPAYGIVPWNTNCSGICRGAINWNGTLYRVMGEYLVRYDKLGVETVIGSVGADNTPVTMDYSFDRLAIASASKFYYYDGVTLTQVTDPDLGIVKDFIWVDGYFMTTDGEFLVITELNNPEQVDPLKYGSSEVDPDPIVAIKKLINEPYAINRYSIESFDNVGGSGFPFRRIDGAKINRGAIGTHACCIYGSDSIAFLGGGRNESTAIWLAAGGSSAKLSTHEIDIIISQYSEEVLSQVELESVYDNNHLFLLIHLPDKTLVYDQSASSTIGEPAWHILSSTAFGENKYRARHFTRYYNKWIVGDTESNSIGYIDKSISTHWGEDIGWEFSTVILYNMNNSAIFHSLELTALTGRSEYGINPVIWTSYSKDGLTWSQERPIQVGKRGNYDKRIIWFNQGVLDTMRIQKFRGLSDSFLSILRLEANLEALIY
jgi:hypothetical protein